MRASADLLAGYYHGVHKVTLEYIASVTPDELSRIVDTRWHPPVTASARLVSIVDDCAQHLGQAAYVRGIAVIRGPVAADRGSRDGAIGLAVRHGSTPLDDWFHQHGRHVRYLMFLATRGSSRRWCWPRSP